MEKIILLNEKKKVKEIIKRFNFLEKMYFFGNWDAFTEGFRFLENTPRSSFSWDDTRIIASYFRIVPQTPKLFFKYSRSDEYGSRDGGYECVVYIMLKNGALINVPLQVRIINFLKEENINYEEIQYIVTSEINHRLREEGEEEYMQIIVSLYEKNEGLDFKSFEEYNEIIINQSSVFCIPVGELYNLPIIRDICTQEEYLLAENEEHAKEALWETYISVTEFFSWGGKRRVNDTCEQLVKLLGFIPLIAYKLVYV